MNPFISPAERLVHGRALATLEAAGVPVLVGGAYAMFHYIGMVRYTKDLDLFLRAQDEGAARAALAQVGYRTELVDPIWLSKAYWGTSFVDLIFCSGNGIAVVDESWFTDAPTGEAAGKTVRFVPPEEMIWSKAFVQERDRWDGADVAHLICIQGRALDWHRLMRLFRPHWQLLLAHLMLFSFSYPQDRSSVPRWVWRELLRRAREQKAERATSGKVCRGTLLSRIQYVPDVGIWGYRDARELEVPGYTRPPPDIQPPNYAAAPSMVASEA